MHACMQVGKFVQFTSTFIGGFVIAFFRGALLALVLCACIPFVIIAASFSTQHISKMQTIGQQAYAKAGSVLEQTVGAIRTVYAPKSNN